MQVLVRAKDFTVTQALQSFAENQAQQLSKREHRLIRIETFLEQTRSQAKATIKAVIPGQDIVVKRSANDMYAAIRQACNRTRRALRKQAGKKLVAKRNGRKLNGRRGFGQA